MVQSVKIPPNHSVVIKAKLMGLQLVDEFIQLSDTTTNTSAKVLLTNSSGITRVDEGTKVGVALPVEVVPPAPEPTQV